MARPVAWFALWLAASAATAEIRVVVGPDGRRVVTNGPAAASPAVRPVAGWTEVTTTPPRAASARPATDRGLDELILDQAGRNDLDPRLVDAVIRAESGYNPVALSSKGAIGLMQLMPETARALAVDPWDLEQNVAGGVRYLRSLMDRFDGDLELALAGYNAGPEAVERHRGVPPYEETRGYVERILRMYYDEPAFALPESAAVPVGRKVHVSRDGNGRLVLTTSRPR